MIKKIWERLFPKNKRTRQISQEELRFAQEARKQFIKLKEKGLSIPIFTL